jgi:hypothetical protein
MHHALALALVSWILWSEHPAATAGGATRLTMVNGYDTAADCRQEARDLVFEVERQARASRVRFVRTSDFGYSLAANGAGRVERFTCLPSGVRPQ